MPDTLPDRIESATDPDALGWWCQSCRKAGMLHCAEVESCVDIGHMKQLPYSERAERFAALRARKDG